MQRRQDKNRETKLVEAEQAWQMRVAGKNLREIGNELNLAPATVSRRLELYISNKIVPTAEHYRNLVIDRLEELRNACQPGIDAGDTKAIQTAAKINMDLHKAAGLEVVKVEAEVKHVSQLDDEISNLLNQMSELDEDKSTEPSETT